MKTVNLHRLLRLLVVGAVLSTTPSCDGSHDADSSRPMIDDLVRAYVDSHPSDVSANMAFGVLTYDEKYLELAERNGSEVARLYLAAGLIGLSEKREKTPDYARAKSLLEHDLGLERVGFARKAMLFKIENPSGYLPIPSRPNLAGIYDFYDDELLFALVDLFVKAKSLTPMTCLWLAALPTKLDDFLYEGFLGSVANTNLTVDELTSLANYFESNILDSPKYALPKFYGYRQTGMLALLKKTNEKIAALKNIDLKNDKEFQERFSQLASIVTKNFEQQKIYTDAWLHPGTLKSGENQYWKTCLQVRDEMKQAASK